MPYIVRPIRLQDGEQKEPWYLKLNPNGRIPTIVDRDEGSPPGREFDAQVFDLKNQRSFGLSASRSQSPSRLTESTSVTRAAPGNTVIHHSPE